MHMFAHTVCFAPLSNPWGFFLYLHGFPDQSLDHRKLDHLSGTAVDSVDLWSLINGWLMTTGKSHRKPWMNWGLAMGSSIFRKPPHVWREFLHREPGEPKKPSPNDKSRSQQPFSYGWFELLCVTFIICQEDLMYMCQEISIIISLFNALMDSIGYLSIVYAHSQTCLKRLQISWPWRLYSVFQQ